MRISRREWHRMIIGGIAAAAAGPLRALDAQCVPIPQQKKPAASASGVAPTSTTGVIIGVQSYSFRDRPLDAAIDGMKTDGLTSCELWQDHVEPKGVSRDELRKWRLTTPMSTFTDVRQKFERAGITLVAYNLSFRDDFTDEEIARGFEMTKALGAPVITASANQTVIPRVAPYAEKAKMKVGVHNHSNIGPNEFATPDDITKALAVSPWIASNLDIGHFTAANFNAVDFLTAHHDRIVTLHIKDRKRNQGDNVPFGQGDTPIKDVLRLLRDNKWPIPANIEYEYKGADTVQEVARCVEYCKTAVQG
jgi:sugar phosphate isomerase/epimerase